jgi:hypothetical protein
MPTKRSESDAWESRIIKRLERMHGLLTGELHLTPKERKQALKMTEQTPLIQQKLEYLQIPLPKDKSNIAIDLGDIYQICQKYIDIINSLLKISRRNKQRLTGLLITLDIELYVHLYYHLNQLRKPLKKLIADLDEEK